MTGSKLDKPIALNITIPQPSNNVMEYYEKPNQVATRIGLERLLPPSYKSESIESALTYMVSNSEDSNNLQKTESEEDFADRIKSMIEKDLNEIKATPYIGARLDDLVLDPLSTPLEKYLQNPNYISETSVARGGIVKKLSLLLTTVNGGGYHVIPHK